MTGRFATERSDGPTETARVEGAWGGRAWWSRCAGVVQNDSLLSPVWDHSWSVSQLVRFTRQDCRHAAVGVIPAIVLISLGHLTIGVAFAIGLLPTSLMGIAPTRRLRVVYGIVGCLFGLGILLGAAVFNSYDLVAAALIFFAVCFGATVLASMRPAGGVLLGILIPALGVGTGYTIADAAGLMVAFVAGSLWSCAVMLPVREFEPDDDVAVRLAAAQPSDAKTYGVILGLTAATSILVGHAFDIPKPGWIATAALLVIRPIQQMTGWRGVGRAVSTIAGTLLVIVTLDMDFGYAATAIVCAVITVLTIGGRTSRLYVTPFGTAFLILTIELYEVDNADSLQEVGHARIVNNVLGALIALFYGLLVTFLLQRRFDADRVRPAR